MRQDGGAALKVVVRLASALRTHAGGASSIEVDCPEPVDVAKVLDAVADAEPAIGRRLRDEAGTLRQHVNIFIGADNARDLDGLSSPVPEGQEVSILPAVSGG
ncbi:MAG: molybdopterin synthase sulfur carrier subunit [Acidimicrobiales bacterium]|nr:molybdopterin synthase sulfur carrier subunit [Acidimicrobiales bacterium]